MAETPQSNTCKILRQSAHTFLTHFHHFTASPTLLCLPFSLSLLLLSSASPATALLLAGGFPPTSHLLPKLSQTLSSLPLSLSFLLLSKSSTIQFLRRRNQSAYFTLLSTQFLNLLLLSAAFSLLYLAFSASPSTATSVAGAVLYSAVVGNTTVLCNLTLIVSGWEGKGGVFPILTAFKLIRGRATTALVLAFPANLGMAMTETIFRCRIYGYGAAERPAWAVAAEAVLIGYLYSVFVVGDTIVGCLFYGSCKEEEGVYETDFNKFRALEEGV